MSMIRKLVSALRLRERGQMMIVFALVVVPISFLLAAVAVDASVWQSERRGAQKDADLSSLAGALELVQSRNKANAETAAIDNADTNDEAGNALALTPSTDASAPNTVVVDDACFPNNPVVNPNSVSVNLDHESQTFFSSIFGLKVAPAIGAHARACAGAAQSPAGLIPIETNTTMAPCFLTGKPQFGQACPMEFGAGTNPGGIIDLDAPPDYCSDGPGSGDLYQLIIDGATGRCLINTTNSCDPAKNGPWYDCVAVQAGNPTKVGRAFRDRIAREGQCDQLFGNGDGIDDFNEAVDLAFDGPSDDLDIYEPRDCDPGADGLQMSPRLVTIIVLDTVPDLSGGSNVGYPIYAFAGFYVEGCNKNPADESDGFDKKCDIPGGGGASAAPNAGDPMFVKYPSTHKCGHQSAPTCTPVPPNTPTATNTPTPPPTNTPSLPPTSTPTGTPEPGCGNESGNANGCIVVWGRLVNLIMTDSETGPPTDATTIFSISLVE